MKDKNLLPFKKIDIIEYDSLTSHIMGIVNSNYEKWKNVLFNNFIDIYCNNAVDFFNARDFEKYEMFEWYHLPRAVLVNNTEQKIINEICKYIDDGFYLIIAFETFYIRNYPNYKSNKMRHLAIIIGYNRDEKKFICGDFFDYTNYFIQSCSMAEIVLGIKNNTEVEKSGFSKNLTILKIVNSKIINIDMNKIICSLKGLCNENFSSEKPYYGLNALDEYIKIINNDDWNKKYKAIRRMPQFFILHMQLMNMRIEFLKSNQRLKNVNNYEKNIEELYFELNKIKNFTYRLMAHNDINIINENKEVIVNRLKYIKEKYIECINEIILELKGGEHNDT